MPARTKVLFTRVSEQEADIVAARAAAEGVTVSEYVRRCALADGMAELKAQFARLQARMERIEEDRCREAENRQPQAR